MTVVQTVDWRTPEAQAVAVAAYRQRDRGRRISPGVALLLLLALGMVNLFASRLPWLLIAAALVGAFMLCVDAFVIRRLLRLAAGSGLTTYWLDSEASLLHIDNALGRFQLPLNLIRRQLPGPQALTLEYAERSTITIPNGPVRTALERSHP